MGWLSMLFGKSAEDKSSASPGSVPTGARIVEPRPIEPPVPLPPPVAIPQGKTDMCVPWTDTHEFYAYLPPDQPIIEALMANLPPGEQALWVLEAQVRTEVQPWGVIKVVLDVEGTPIAETLLVSLGEEFTDGMTCQLLVVAAHDGELDAKIWARRSSNAPWPVSTVEEAQLGSMNRYRAWAQSKHNFASLTTKTPELFERGVVNGLHFSARAEPLQLLKKRGWDDVVLLECLASFEGALAGNDFGAPTAWPLTDACRILRRKGKDDEARELLARYLEACPGGVVPTKGVLKLQQVLSAG